MRQVRTHRLNGVKYYIDVDDPYIGWCDRPKKPDLREYPRIALPNGLAFGSSKQAKEDLHTLIHECCHAENWELSEQRVDQIANDVAGLLWRLGYRRKKL